MSELSTEEQERLDNWKALQLALGLSPEEAAAAVPPPKSSAPASIPPVRAERPKPTPVADEEVHLFGAGLALEEPAVETGAEAEANREVEVGEAPEEIPEEPTGPEERKRRRRRRRRRRNEPNGGETGMAEPTEAESPIMTEAGVNLLPTDAEEAEDEDLEDSALPEEEEEEVEAISFADWTVPSWNELIGSLYRPER